MFTVLFDANTFQVLIIPWPGQIEGGVFPVPLSVIFLELFMPLWTPTSPIHPHPLLVTQQTHAPEYRDMLHLRHRMDLSQTA